MITLQAHIGSAGITHFHDDIIKFCVKKLSLILSGGLCEGGALPLALRSAPSAKLNLILAKFYEVLIFAQLCIKTKLERNTFGKYKTIEQKLSSGQLAVLENQEQKKAELKFCFFSILF